MEPGKIFRSTLLVLFIMFIGLYTSAQVGLIDYQARNKTLMTEEAIKEFENDIKDGKKVDIKKYVVDKNKKYDNGLSKATLKVSNSIGKSIDGILKLFFKKMEKIVNN